MPDDLDAHAPADMWEGWDELTEAPEEGEETAVTARERKEVDLIEFWRSRKTLSRIHEYAKARRAGPWAVLGCVLARVIATTPPNVVLPPVVGGAASLNLFVGLVGKSGTGKDAANNAARSLLDIGGGWADYLEAPVGSGEGLSHMFMRPVKATKDDPHPYPEQYNAKALVRIGEIDALAAQQSRQASTLSAQLRYAAMGEELGAFYVDLAKRMIVPKHSYRLCIVGGIQPTRAGVLLDDADGGTPQRWIWLPAGDPTATREVPEAPDPLYWEPPDLMTAERLDEGGRTFYQLGLPPAALDAIIDARVRSQREEESAGLDSHAMLTREKVAGGLGLLEGRLTPDDEDWRLSGVIMTVSDAQRARCQKAIGEKAAASNQAQAVAEAERTVVVGERVEQSKRRKLARTIKNRVAKCGSAGETPGKLKNSLASGDRDLFDDVLDSLMVAGEVRTEGDGRNVRYFLVL